jgi:hypothetical protein
VSKRIAQIVVLAEDLVQVNFVFRYLNRMGYSGRKIRAVQSPAGRGSGEQYVREQYPNEVGYYRNRARQRSAALVAVIDADKKTVQDRENELQRALETAGEALRRANESIVLLIPKRHIETWIRCLVGENVDEIQDYARLGSVQENIRPAAETFYEWSRPNYEIPRECVDSLRRGLVETRRIH